MKYKRIKKNTQFQKLFNRGKRVFSPCLTVLYYPSATLSMGIAVSKKHGKATVRNRIKRLVREAFSSVSDKLEKPCDIIIIPKVAESYSLENFKKSLIYSFKKVNVCLKNSESSGN